MRIFLHHFFHLALFPLGYSFYAGMLISVIASLRIFYFTHAYVSSRNISRRYLSSFSFLVDFTISLMVNGDDFWTRASSDDGKQRDVLLFLPRCYVHPASRVTKCIRRHPPSSARACASLSFDRFDGNRAEGSSTLVSRPRFDLFHFLFSLEKGRKKRDAAQSKRHFFLSLSLLSSLLIRIFFTVCNNEDMRCIKK